MNVGTLREERRLSPHAFRPVLSAARAGRACRAFSRTVAALFAPGMAALLAGGLTIAPAQDISISGRVTDTADNGLANATVALLKRRLWAASGPDGAFRIEWSSALVPKGPNQVPAAPSIRSGRLCFNVASDRCPVKAVLFDARGRVAAAPLEGRLAPGAYEIPLPAMARGVYVARLTVDRAQSVIRTVCGSAGAGAPAPHGIAALASAAAGVVDTLSVTLPGYAPACVLVGTYDTALTVVLRRRPWITFSINSGTGYVTHPACTLLIGDSSLSLSGARFTQVCDSVPDFDRHDTLNPRRQVALGERPWTRVPWVLLPGGGEKRVWAEIAWRDTLRGRDTLLARAAITPWAVDIRVRNRLLSGLPQDSGPRWAGLERTEAVHYRVCPYPHTPCRETYVIGRAPLLFSLDIRGDTTFADTFEYWVVAPCSSAELSLARMLPDFDTAGGLVTTTPRKASLGGSGTLQDTGVVYRYSVDTATADGAENLSALRYLRWDSSQPAGTRSDTVRDRPGANFLRLAALKQSALTKEFSLALRLRGRLFGEERLVFSRQIAMVASAPWRIRSFYFDFYPPALVVSSPFYGDTIRGPFRAVTGGSLDGCGLPPLSMAILAVRKPPGMVWDCWNWPYAPFPRIALDDLLAQRHELYRCAQPDSLLCEQTIDPSSWQSGEYLIAVVAGDVLGNEGLAPGGGCATNPVLVYVASGR